MPDSALIFGISGQDGTLLAKLLLDKGYAVAGTSRDAEVSPFANLERAGIRDRVSVHSAVLTDFRSVVQVIDAVGPDEIYNLSGPTSVGLSFSQPVEAVGGSALGAINVLEAIRFLRLRARIYQASSGECFGNTVPAGADETTSFRPRSPYGVGKAAAHMTVANYREAYGLYACSGILFNHESALRSPRFVTQKVVRGAADIAEGAAASLALGELSVSRDWGWAEEYVEAMWRMLQLDAPDDFVVASGEAYSLEAFVAEAFGAFGLDWRDHVDSDRRLFRPADIDYSRGNPAKAEAKLGWRARRRMPEVVAELVAAERERRGG